MIYKEGTESESESESALRVSGMIKDVEKAIIKMTIRSTDIFAGCAESTSTRRRNQESDIVGISSSPDDTLADSDCGGDCVRVEGQLTLYLSSENRQLSSVNDHTSDLLSSMKVAMENGKLIDLTGNNNIVELEYLTSVNGGSELQNTDTEKDRIPVAATDIPPYLYAFFGLVGTAFVAVLFFSMKHRMRRSRKRNLDEEACYPEAAMQFNDSPSSISYLPRNEEGHISLYDDASSNFIDTSAVLSSRAMMAWKSNSNLDDSSSLDYSGVTKSRIINIHELS